MRLRLALRALTESVTRTTRGNRTPQNMSIVEVAQLHHATLRLNKRKYIYLCKAGKKLTSPTKKGGQPPALPVAEEQRSSAFTLTEITHAEACLDFTIFTRSARKKTIELQQEWKFCKIAAHAVTHTPPDFNRRWGLHNEGIT